MEFYYRETEEEKLDRFWWLPYLAFGIVTALLSYPILNNISNWGIRDWDLFTTLHAAAVHSVTEYGQFPFWNPYIGGGNILFAHPEVPVLNPLFLLQLIFGPLAGLKLQVITAYYLGFIGSYKLARKFGVSFYGSFITPLVYMLSSYFALHFSAGHIPFHYFAALPWLLYYYRKSIDNPWHILSVGGVVAFYILGSGAAVPVVFSLFFLFLFSLFDIGRKYKLTPPVYAIAGGLCGVLFGAVKFIPMVDYLFRNPWIPDGTVMKTPVTLLPTMLFTINQSMFSGYAQGYVYGWHEYGAYLGPIAAILVIIGLLFQFRDNWKYAVLAVISIILVLGSFMPWSPWDVLHKLPGFESIRVPSRFIVLALFAMAILAGKGLDILAAMFSFRRGALTMLLFIAISGTHLLVSLPILNEAFTRKPEKVEQRADFKQVEGDPNRMYAAFLSNEGTIKAAWLSAYRGGRGIYDGQNLKEWYSENDRITVLNRDFTPNRITFNLKAPVGGNLIVGQGFDPGWRRINGTPISDFHDLVSCRIDAGESKLEIYYRPDYFYLGLIISIVSILGAIAAPIVYRRLSS
ncbi:MAG: hypothetical protein KAR42_01340 [candidate division Zixibacteria bacterium]|nr:hypothetical protein [candidate division Zixibacteria bacterium]